MPLRLPALPLAWIRGGYASLRKMELRVLLAGVAIAACLWGFVELAEHASEGGSAFDETVFALLRDPDPPHAPIGPPQLQGAMRDITALGSWTILLLITVIVSLGMIAAGHRRLPLLIIGACLSGLILGSVLKSVVSRERPGAEFRTVETYTSSFPSGHSMNAAVVYLTLGALVAQGQRRKISAIFALATGIGLALLVGFSRVYLGVHWPTDVLGGWAAGFGWAVLWWAVADRVRARARRLKAPGAAA
jgi:undecaprenyl-diphosphatase